jgi:3-hydroxybutyryl-CoA dehydratase
MKYIVGQKAFLSKKVTSSDVYQFAEITGDKNRIHLDEKYAENTIFKNRIVHGILCAGLISSVIANLLPGDGSIYIGQDLKFLAPVFHNEKITAEVEIIEVIKEKKHLILKTTVTKGDGTVAITGTARVKITNNDYK